MHQRDKTETEHAVRHRFIRIGASHLHQFDARFQNEDPAELEPLLPFPYGTTVGTNDRLAFAERQKIPFEVADFDIGGLSSSAGGLKAHELLVCLMMLQVKTDLEPIFSSGCWWVVDRRGCVTPEGYAFPSRT